MYKIKEIYKGKKTALKTGILLTEQWVIDNQKFISENEESFTNYVLKDGETMEAAEPKEIVKNAEANGNSAAEMKELIDLAETVEEVEELIKGEDRKTVLKAAEKKISELK